MSEEQQVRFRLIIAEDAATRLAQDPSLNATISPALERDKNELKCGIETAAAIVTIVVAVPTLIDMSRKIARTLVDAGSKHPETQDNVVVQGERAERLIEGYRNQSPDRLAEKISSTAMPQQ